MDGRLKILHLEYNPLDIEWVHSILAIEDIIGEIRQVKNAADFEAALNQAVFDIVLVSYTIPEYDGLAALNLVQEITPKTPVIILASTLDEEKAIDCFHAGAADYVIKEHLVRLVPAIQRALEIQQLKRVKNDYEKTIFWAQSAIEHTTEMILCFEQNGRILFANKATSQTLGFSFNDLLVLKIYQIAPQISEKKWKEFWILLRKIHYLNIETTFLNKEGDVLAVEMSINFVNCDGHEYVCTFARDLSRVKLLEQKIEDHDVRLNQITAQNYDVIIFLDQEGRINYVSPGLKRLQGFDTTDLLEQLLIDFFPNSSLETIKQAIASCLKGKTIQHLELEIECKTGRLIMIEGNMTPIVQADEIYGVQFIYHDISKRILLEDQFRQSQKMEAIGQLAGGMAHDFNNLLTAILGYTELLIMDLNPGDPILGTVQEIERAGKRAEALTRQLLAFSRKQVIQPKVLDLGQLIQNMEKMLRRLIGEDIELITILEPETGNIRADSGQIQQMVMNIVINARDAMPEGGKITIQLKKVNFSEVKSWENETIEPASFLMLAISDTGIGMSPETLSHIFEPFYTTKQEEKGTGLGLSTVYGIMKQNGGYINIETELNRGTTFQLFIPRVLSEVTAVENKPVESVLRGKETILVVEDESFVRDLACRVLRMHGYNVLEAPNGGSALLKCERHPKPIHLILTDVVMPELSGRDLAERLEKIHPEAKVLYMSGYTDDAVIRHGITEEQVHFLQKPFTPLTLLQKIREVLNSESV